ncbi:MULTISPECIES: replication initiator [Microbacterium]|jgi:hypothetical protein|uniref:replication initiator n=1 Tax=Microbacterium schleiferi TaxID=69362 RepID=UPI001D177899|nr:replication initiator [Microbacterium schleiferi]MCC4267008.1 replication initiation protein [Microbacterium schleiferi]
MRLDESVARRLRSEEYDRWMHNVASTGYCLNPVRLVGSSTTLHEASGEILSEYSSTSEPDGVTFTRCGNRRATRCESCSHEYKGDTWHMIMAGAAGGMKEVPEEVAEHPMVFLTLTAPSFGAVHTTAVDRRTGVCEHGKPRGCRCHHDDDDPQRGDAVCAECYDYVGHVVWQYHAPELWRRFTIRLRRELARSLGMTQRAAARVVRLQFAKVAEFQRRGVVHFHAIIRLDGIHPELPFPAPPAAVTTDHLVTAIQSAVRKTSVAAAPLPGDARTRTLAWGKQFDVRPIVRREGLDGALSDRAVAAYIAKYATKATEELEPTGSGRDHIKRIKSTVRELATVVDSEGPYEQLHRWDGMLGFRGHFSTKSRRYSVTLGSLRGARRTWRLKHLLAKTKPTEEINPDEVLVIGSWAYAGMGWLTDGDKALAREAADAARQWRHDRARDRNTPPTERSTT